jgi:hypothetical protein
MECRKPAFGGGYEKEICHRTHRIKGISGSGLEKKGISGSGLEKGKSGK